MNRADIARQVARQLFAAEDALDASIRDYARLTVELMEARTRLGLSGAVGPEVVARAAAVQGALAAARTESAALHAALAEVKDGVGLRAVAVGAGDKTNMPNAAPAWPMGSASEPLRAVG